MATNEDLLVLEVVDENDRPVPHGVVGRKVLVTTLSNWPAPIGWSGWNVSA